MTAIFRKLGIAPADTEHRRVLAVLTYLQGHRGALIGTAGATWQCGGRAAPWPATARGRATSGPRRRAGRAAARGRARRRRAPRSRRVFDAVADEACRLLGGHFTALLRYRARRAARHRRHAGRRRGRATSCTSGMRIPEDGDGIVQRVRRTARAARIDGYDGVPGSNAATARDARAEQRRRRADHHRGPRLGSDHRAGLGTAAARQRRGPPRDVRRGSSPTAIADAQARAGPGRAGRRAGGAAARRRARRARRRQHEELFAAVATRGVAAARRPGRRR